MWFSLCYSLLWLQYMIVDSFVIKGQAASARTLFMTSSSSGAVSQEMTFVEYELNARGKGEAKGTRQVVKVDLSSNVFNAKRVAPDSHNNNRRSNSGEDGESVATEQDKISTRIERWRNSLANNFIPSGDISPDYFTYTKWKCMQRFVAGTSSVFGTQALVMALGVKNSKALGIAAGTMWVMKDALGKLYVSRKGT